MKVSLYGAIGKAQNLANTDVSIALGSNQIHRLGNKTSIDFPP